MKSTLESSTAEPRLLTVQQAAGYLATTVAAIRQLQWDARIPFLRIGKRVQFDRRDLDAFIMSQKTLSS